MNVNGRIRISDILAAVILSSTCAFAHARDPCESLMCMMGKVQGGVSGNGGKEDGCVQGITDFESIIQMHHGHMDLNATPLARRNYLNSCPGSASDAAAINAIISQFGNVIL